jgi:D-beta-D-heptose 7-phosphate kinase / D-beta-D-heptose 1-phosphate adenosyltransferase
MKPLLVLGDALLDRDVSGQVRRICPDAPVPVLDEELTEARPGGAALAAVLAAADGREVTLLSALGEDEAGRLLARLLAAAGVELIDLGLCGATPEKVRLRSGGQSLLRLDRGGSPAAIGELSAAGRAAIGWAEAILASDYGRGLTAHPAVRAALSDAAREKPLVWDPHVRGTEPVAQVELATPNEAEARAFATGGEDSARRQDAGRGEDAGRGRDAGWGEDAEWGASAAILCERWQARNVCVTRGAAGAVLCEGAGAARAVPAPRLGAGDPCGAGDRFCSAAAGALADGRPALEAVRHGVAQASAFVASGGAAAMARPEPKREPVQGGVEPAIDLAARVRAAGGTVVAAGGCFDLLHAGHVRLLSAARELGDCLIVCLNSDASVRRLKGPTRPLVAQEDRAAVLSALGCVDAVAVFEEPTPVQVLERLRPDVWAKGGDYAAEELPERSTIERWGGRVVTLPYIAGHSTTGLLEEVAGRVAG